VLRPAATAQFKRDRKLMKKRGKEVAKLDQIMTILAREDTLPPSQHAHRLAGEYRGHWECHIEPDWLLLWYTTEAEVVFVRTGTHSDLFG
jgi:mRNA interferase YafQ